MLSAAVEVLDKCVEITKPGGDCQKGMTAQKRCYFNNLKLLLSRRLGQDIPAEGTASVNIPGVK